MILQQLSKIAAQVIVSNTNAWDRAKNKIIR